MPKGTTIIPRSTLRAPQTHCPKCGGGDLVVAKSPTREPTLINPRPRAHWLGYDCRSCGEELRFRGK